MTQIKRKLSILLCFIIAFTTVLAAAPAEVNAATDDYRYYLSGPATYEQTKEIVVYNGAANLYAGDFIEVDRIHKSTADAKYLGYLSLLKGATYKSSKPSVATINKTTGKIKTKKAGTTIITVKYNGKTVKFNLTVLSKTKFFKKLSSHDSSYTQKAATAYDKKANAFLRKTGKIPTISNSTRYELLSAYKSYSSCEGYLMISDSDSNAAASRSYYYYSTPSAHAFAIYGKIGNYSYSLSPFRVDDPEWENFFEIKSISGKNNKITITLKKKVTADMIYGANYAFSWKTKVKESDKYSFPIVVQDTSDNRKYYAVATVTKGSDEMIIKLKKHKLVKGQTYKLLARTSTSKNYTVLGDWLDNEYCINQNNSKFTAK